MDRSPVHELSAVNCHSLRFKYLSAERQETKEPDLVLARDNQTVIQRRSQLLTQHQATRKEKSKTLSNG